MALAGQPNCGKSTLFNAVAGYRSATGNFAGTTVRLTWCRVRVNGSPLELMDVPGIYSLTASSPTEIAAKEFLLSGNADLIVNVVDASLLHACAAAPNCTYPSDILSYERVNNLLVKPLDRRGSYYIVPDTPGLGVELDMDAVKRYAAKT